jgi:hypothetical protein
MRDFGVRRVFAVLRDRPGWRGCGADADAPLRDVLAAALEANERLARLAEELRAENARLREEPAATFR